MRTSTINVVGTYRKRGLVGGSLTGALACALIAGQFVERSAISSIHYFGFVAISAIVFGVIGLLFAELLLLQAVSTIEPAQTIDKNGHSSNPSRETEIEQSDA